MFSERTVDSRKVSRSQSRMHRKAKGWFSLAHKHKYNASEERRKGMIVFLVLMLMSQ